MTIPSESNPYASPSEAGGIPFGPGDGNRAVVDNPEIARAMAGTRPWVLMLGILGLLGTALMGLVGLIGVVPMLSTSRLAGAGVLQGMVLLVITAVGLAVSIYLLSYGRRIGDFLRTHDQADLAAALLAQRSYWRLIGILAILYAVLLVLMIPLMVLG